MNLYTNSTAQRLASIIANKQTKSQARLGLIFNLSKLHDNHKNDEHFNIALNVLRDQLQSCIGDIFSFKDGDIFVIFNGKNSKQLEEAIFQMRYLFIDDPLAYSSPGIANNNFCQLFDLEKQWSEFCCLCEEKIFKAENDNFEPAHESRVHLKHYITANIENALFDIDIENYISFSSICMSYDEDSYKPLLREIEIDRNKLKQVLSNKLDILDNPHLYKFFNEIIDIRLLIKLLELSKEKPTRGIGLVVNLALSTLKSEEFELFDSALSEKFKRNIVISLSLGDVFDDINEFILIRDHIQAKGYKLCLSDITQRVFNFIERDVLGFDLIKLKYDDSLRQIESSELFEQLSAKIQLSGSSRIILTNSNTFTALGTGSSLGIFLFQGKYFSKLFDQ